MDIFLEKIKNARKLLKLSQSQLAEAIGMAQKDVSNIENGSRQYIPIQYISFLQERGIDIRSLYNLKTENVTLVTNPVLETENVEVIHRANHRANSKSKLLPLQKEQEPIIQYVVRDDYDLIDVPLIDMAAAANSKSGFIPHDSPETLDHFLVPASMLRKGRQNYAFRVVNDSMEPTLYMDDIIIVTHVEPSNYDQLKEDRVCVVVSKSKGVLVKRIRNRLEDSKLIRCRSDNKFYHSFNVYAEDLLNIFEVRCKISFNLPNEMSNIYDMYRKLEDRIEDLEERQKPR